VLVSASGIGYYGDYGGDTPIDESAPTPPEGIIGEIIITTVISSIINHQSSIINHQSSIINHQSSIINHQSSSSSSSSSS
jgi:hypothetical protein